MTKHVLVTGGAGFIGANFIQYLLDAFDDYSVVSLDKLTYAGNPDNLRECSRKFGDRYTFIRGDIADGGLVKDVLQKHRIDYLVNFAAESHVDRSIMDASVFIQTNVLGTQVLLDRALEVNIERFVHISTDEVYGSLGPDGLFTEESPLAPNSPYAASKAGADHLCRAYFNTHRFPVLITRSSNNYGPFQHPEKLIPLLITNAFEDKPLPIYGDGKNVRDWLYVEDNVAAVELVMRNGRAGEVYNIGGNNEWENLQVVKRILENLKKPDSLIQFVTDRPGHDRRYALDCRKMKDELEWEPRHDFQDGLYKTIQWYTDNAEWLQRARNKDFQVYYKDMYDNR